MRIEDALAARMFTAGQFEIVTALLSPADVLGADVLGALARIASRGMIVAGSEDVRVNATR